MSRGEQIGDELNALLRKRILLLDGAMGTMIQARKLDEAGYRGREFARHGKDLRLNNDALNLSQPQIIGEIHQQYLEAGADIIETNTFNSTAVSMAEYALEARVVDRSGRTLSGQTVEAFWISISHMPLFSVGMNCALGAKEMRPFLEELSRLAPIPITCYPNAGLPNAFGGFDETPERMAADLEEFARNGWLNIAGGCCGSTPELVRAIGAAIWGGAAPGLAE